MINLYDFKILHREKTVVLLEPLLFQFYWKIMISLDAACLLNHDNDHNIDLVTIQKQTKVEISSLCHSHHHHLKWRKTTLPM